MADQEQKKPQSPSESTSDAAEVEVDVKGSELTDGIDDLLDEIDSVLEENAEEFVKNYVQKGGQ